MLIAIGILTLSLTAWTDDALFDEASEYQNAIAEVNKEIKLVRRQLRAERLDQKFFESALDSYFWSDQSAVISSHLSLQPSCCDYQFDSGAVEKLGRPAPYPKSRCPDRVNRPGNSADWYSVGRSFAPFTNKQFLKICDLSGNGKLDHQALCEMSMDKTIGKGSNGRRSVSKKGCIAAIKKLTEQIKKVDQTSSVLAYLKAEKKQARADLAYTKKVLLQKLRESLQSTMKKIEKEMERSAESRRQGISMGDIDTSSVPGVLGGGGVIPTNIESGVN